MQGNLFPLLACPVREMTGMRRFASPNKQRQVRYSEWILIKMMMDIYADINSTAGKKTNFLFFCSFPLLYLSLPPFMMSCLQVQLASPAGRLSQSRLVYDTEGREHRKPLSLCWIWPLLSLSHIHTQLDNTETLTLMHTQTYTDAWSKDTCTHT